MINTGMTPASGGDHHCRQKGRRTGSVLPGNGNLAKANPARETEKITVMTVPERLTITLFRKFLPRGISAVTPNKVLQSGVLSKH